MDPEMSETMEELEEPEVLGEEEPDETDGTEEEPDEMEEAAQQPQKRNLEADRIAAQARRAMEAEKRENEAFAREMGYASFEEFKRAGIEARQNAIKKKIEEGDLSAVEPLIEQKLGSMPEVAAMRELSEQQQRRQQEEVIERDIRELNAQFPDANIKTKEDLLLLPNAGEIIRAAQAGVPLYRAYAAYAVDSIVKKRSEAAKRAALNAQSKDHLRKAGGTGGKAGTPIPKETLEMYHALNPKVPEKEIMEHWRKNGGK